MNENYEDYDDEKKIEEEEYEEVSQDDEEKESRRKKIILLILIIIGIIIIILLLTRCGRGDNDKFDIEKTLLEAGKEYYGYNENEIPKTKSSCTTVSLSTLVADGLLDPDKYKDCDGDKTYVKVCLLSNGKVHYVPILKCDSFNSDDKYKDWEEGKLDDIIPDKTDVKFAYLGQALKKDTTSSLGETKEVWYGEETIPYKSYKTLDKTTYYRYRDLQYRWYNEIRLYYPYDGTTPGAVFYISSPADGYINKDNEQYGFKWYKLLEGGTKEYCEGYHATAPNSECTKPDTSDGYQIVSRTRTFTEYDAVKIYVCADIQYKTRLEAGDTTNIVMSREYHPCGSSENANPNYTYEHRTYYSCDAASDEVAQGSKCKLYSEWGNYSKERCTGEADVCQNLDTPINYFKWYKESGIRSYYTSGSTTASGETTYYLTAPAAGYIKDESTGATVWSWYKKTGSITEEYYTTAPNSTSTKSEYSRWTDWSDWTTTAVSSLGNSGNRNIQTRIKLKIQEITNTTDKSYENIMKDYTFDVNELIKAFKDKGYDVNTLEDIALNGELKYLVKIYVRNK